MAVSSVEKLYCIVFVLIEDAISDLKSYGNRIKYYLTGTKPPPVLIDLFRPDSTRCAMRLAGAPEPYINQVYEEKRRKYIKQLKRSRRRHIAKGEQDLLNFTDKELKYYL